MNNKIMAIIRDTDKRTFTKVMVRLLLIIAIINAEIPYILAIFGKETNEALGITWIVNIIAVSLGYMLKAHFDKNKERENDRLDDIHSKVNWTPEEETSGSIAP